MADSYRLRVRQGGRVERLRVPTLDRALVEIESRAEDMRRGARARPVDTKVMGRFEPVQQVVARLELAGPGGFRGGVDVRGDGSAEAYTGRVRRQLVQQHADESPYDALRRAASGSGTAG